MRIDEIADTDPSVGQWLMKLHKGATAGFNAKTTQAVLNLFPGWSMVKQDFIKPSDELGWNKEGFGGLVRAELERYSHWSKKMETYTASLHAMSDRPNGTTLHVRSHWDGEAKALHAKVAEFVVTELPDPKKAKADDYFVMNLTEPQPTKDKDGETEWVWSFGLFRKCKGYRITAPNGEHFDVCGPTKVLGYGGTKDFDAFFKWALANTDLETQVNERLGLSKHLKASERPRVPVGGQTIGTCAICLRQQVVRNGAMVLHGYQRPGHGYIIGDCFGAGHEPYEISAEACKAYIPVLQHHQRNYEQRLAALKAGEVTEFTETKRNFRTGKDERIVISKGDPKFDAKLNAAIADTEGQIGKIKADIAEMHRRIKDWAPGTLRRNEGIPGIN